MFLVNKFRSPVGRDEAQRRDPGSLLNWMVRMIRLRKECPEIGWGEWKTLELGSPAVLGLCYEHRGRRIVVLHNFSSEPQRVQVRLKGSDATVLANLLEEEQSTNSSGIHRITLPAFGYSWFRAGGLSYSIHREPSRARA